MLGTPGHACGRQRADNAALIRFATMQRILLLFLLLLFLLFVSFWASRAPWLAYGLRSLRAQLTYLKTYGGDAGAFGVFYCARRVGWVDTRWDDKISLITTTAFDLPPCKSLSLVSWTLRVWYSSIDLPSVVLGGE